MRRLKNSLAGIGIIAMCGGCVAAQSQDTTTDPANPGWTVEPPVDVTGYPTDTPTSTVTSSPLASCDVVDRWAVTEDRFWYEPALFDYSPNDGLIVRAPGLGGNVQAIRAHDGLGLAGLSTRAVEATDASWTWGIESRWNEALTVRSLVTDDTRLALTAREGAQWVGSSLSSDGNLVAAAWCEFGQPSRAGVHVVDTNSGATLHEWALEGADATTCNSWDNSAFRVHFSVDDQALFVGMPRSGGLIRFDLATEAAIRVHAHDLTVIEESWGIEQAIVGVAIDPRGDWLATTGGDGFLRIFDATTLALVRETPGIGVFLINEMTYAPQMHASPVAFSKRGDLMAWSNPERGMVVANRAGEILHTFAVQDDPEIEARFGMTNDPLQLAFSNDGTELAMGYYFGTQVVGCDIVRERREGAIAVRLEGPTQVRVGERVSYTATHLGQTLDVHAHQFFVGGAAYSTSVDSSRILEWTPHEIGQIEIEVLIDDGVASGSQTLMVDVIP